MLCPQDPDEGNLYTAAGGDVQYLLGMSEVWLCAAVFFDGLCLQDVPNEGIWILKCPAPTELVFHFRVKFAFYWEAHVRHCLILLGRNTMAKVTYKRRNLIGGMLNSVTG